MKLTVLGSGSTGNAVLIVANGTRVLVDAGLSARETARQGPNQQTNWIGCGASRSQFQAAHWTRELWNWISQARQAAECHPPGRGLWRHEP